MGLNNFELALARSLAEMWDCRLESSLNISLIFEEVGGGNDSGFLCICGAVFSSNGITFNGCCLLYCVYCDKEESGREVGIGLYVGVSDSGVIVDGD